MKRREITQQLRSELSIQTIIPADGWHPRFGQVADLFRTRIREPCSIADLGVWRTSRLGDNTRLLEEGRLYLRARLLRKWGQLLDARVVDRSGIAIGRWPGKSRSHRSFGTGGAACPYRPIVCRSPDHDRDPLGPRPSLPHNCNFDR